MNLQSCLCWIVLTVAVFVGGATSVSFLTPDPSAKAAVPPSSPTLSQDPSLSCDLQDEASMAACYKVQENGGRISVRMPTLLRGERPS